MHPNGQPTRQLSVTGWIGAPPELRAATDVVNSLVDELIEIVRPFGIDAVHSSEPRTYRLAPKGRANLARAIAARRLDTVILSTPLRTEAGLSIPEMMGGKRAEATIGFPIRQVPFIATRVAVQLSPADESGWAGAATVVTDFVRRWAEELRAAAAFVSVAGRNDL